MEIRTRLLKMRAIVSLMCAPAYAANKSKMKKTDISVLVNGIPGSEDPATTVCGSKSSASGPWIQCQGGLFRIFFKDELSATVNMPTNCDSVQLEKNPLVARVGESGGVLFHFDYAANGNLSDAWEYVIPAGGRWTT